MQINETRTNPPTMHKNKLKMAERIKHKTRHHQTPGREHRQNILNLTNVFSGQSPKAIAIKAKINPDTYGQLIFDKGGKNIKREKVFRASTAGKTGQLHANQWN